jgi:hypothetical protein
MQSRKLRIWNSGFAVVVDSHHEKNCRVPFLLGENKFLCLIAKFADLDPHSILLLDLDPDGEISP